MSNYLIFDNISKSFGETKALNSFSVDVKEGELVTLLGPSGCGKSTALRVAAGFEEPNNGDVQVDGKSVLGLTPNQRQMGIVFQNYSLFPHLTVTENLEFGMRVRKVSKTKRKARASELLDLVRLEGLAERYPHQLSGGQQQRVALARALAVEPSVLLLDEPLSALDATVRLEVREEIRRIQQRSGIATLFVTHDQEEALAISDRVCVMNNGTVEQIGSPVDIYRHPSTPFVARFVGRVNDLAVQVISPIDVQLRDHPSHFRVAKHTLPAGAARLLIRPEDIQLTQLVNDSTLRGSVHSVHFAGATTSALVAITGTPHTVRVSDSTRSLNCAVGDEVGLTFDMERALLTHDD
jgi:putative spermidine/putrescine transport system ATP-binding protein